jgi:hypothetical protein
MPGTVGYKKLDIRCCLPLEFVKITIDFFLRILEKLGIYGARFDGMLVNHLFHFFYMKREVILDREIGDKHVGLHLGIGQVIPARLFGFFYTGKIRIIKRITAWRAESGILWVGILQAQISFGLGNWFFATGKQRETNNYYDQIFKHSAKITIRIDTENFENLIFIKNN